MSIYLLKPVAIFILYLYLSLIQQVSHRESSMLRLFREYNKLNTIITYGKLTSSSWIIATVRQPAFEGPLKSLNKWSPK